MHQAQRSEDECTLEQFDYMSKTVAKFLRTFGVPAEAENNLNVIAIYGAEPKRWVAWWKDRIIQLNGDAGPVSIRPWKGNPLSEIEWVGPCAHSAATWLLSQLWTNLFPDNPQWNNLGDDVPRYIAEHSDEMTKSLAIWFQHLNRTEWLKLESRMEIERANLVGQFGSADAPGYLGLIVNKDRQEVCRVGHTAPVKFFGLREWELFVALYGAGERGLTRDEVNKLSGEPAGKRNLKSRLKTTLLPLGITVPNLEWKLVEVPKAAARSQSNVTRK